jgi:hypothetical protein
LRRTLAPSTYSGLRVRIISVLMAHSGERC